MLRPGRAELTLLPSALSLFAFSASFIGTDNVGVLHALNRIFSTLFLQENH